VSESISVRAVTPVCAPGALYGMPSEPGRMPGSRMLTVLRSGDDSVLEWCLVGGAGVPSRSRLPRGQPNRPACGQPV